uniref:lysoplasmalogenase n=1 Tax=uncultured Draconibacterium sp. TaxID=1573823 RepID=UPI003218021C
MSIKNPFLLLLIPLVCSVLAYTGYGFEFQLAVAASCIGIIFITYWKKIKSFSDIFYVIGALVFSMGGDWFLSNKGDSFMMFAAGIGLYFFAHLGYLIFALINGKIHKLLLFVLLVVYLAFYVFALYPAIDEKILSVFTFVYLLISCVSVAAAAGTGFLKAAKWSYFAGIVFILLSDTIIAFKEFLSYPELNFLILPTYYAAHICITFALIKRITKKQVNGAKVIA